MDNPSNRLVIYLVALASIFIVMFGIRETASIINPILLASVITIAVLPIPGKLTKRGLPGWLALILTILAVVLLLVLVMATVFFSVTQLSIALPTYMADAATSTSAEASGSETTTSTTELTIQYGPFFQSIIAAVLDMLVQFGIALAIFFFMISAAMSLPSAVRLGLDPRAQIIGKVTKLTEDVRHYLTILTGINLLVGLGDTIFLMYLGVDFAVLWGLLAWFMGYIPSIGFMIALIPPMLMAYAQYGLEHSTSGSGRLHPDQRRRAEFHPAQDHGAGTEDQPGGGICRVVHLGVPSRWHRRTAGGAAYPAGFDDHGEF